MGNLYETFEIEVYDVGLIVEATVIEDMDLATRQVETTIDIDAVRVNTTDNDRVNSDDILPLLYHNDAIMKMIDKEIQSRVSSRKDRF